MDNHKLGFINEALVYILVQLHKTNGPSLEDSISWFEKRGQDSSDNIGFEVGKPYLDFAHQLKQALSDVSISDSQSPIQ